MRTRLIRVVPVILLLVAAPVRTAERSRSDLMRTAAVWQPGNISARDLRAGPEGPGRIVPDAMVACTYVDRPLAGNTPKFACRVGEDELKVKYGGTNGEVFGEVLATRLLWALGFGADRVYPARIVCTGCPESVGGVLRADGTRLVAPAVIEHKFGGRNLLPDGDGWAWPELDGVDPRAGGAPRAHRDAFKLLAVLMQHTDSKRDQQRLVCLDDDKDGKGDKDDCARTFLLLQDVGRTFGHATLTNGDEGSSVNLLAWQRTSVWRDETGCVGNLPRSLTGTLDNPQIGEAGRAFLAGLLSQLSDRQLRDLFTVARVQLRPRDPAHGRSGFPTVGEWVETFRRKQAEIASRRCTVPEGAAAPTDRSASTTRP